MDDDSIRVLVRRLSRPHPSGGKVIERAAILAEGSDSTQVLDWITAHSGVPEEAVLATSSHGLHGSHSGDRGSAGSRPPLRFVLPAAALDSAPSTAEPEG